MTIEQAAFAISVLSLLVAVSAFSLSIHRYRLQVQAFELQRKETDEKYKSRLQVVDEQFLTSHTLGPNEPPYYVEHPEEIEFEYKARYQNKGFSLIEIKSLMLTVSAVEVQDVFNCGEIIIVNRALAPGEQLEVCHRFNKRNLDGFKWMVEEIAGKRGVLQFEVKCDFLGLDGLMRAHRRILYRLTEGGGDISCRGYDPGRGKEKHSFVY